MGKVGQSSAISISTCGLEVELDVGRLSSYIQYQKSINKDFVFQQWKEFDGVLMEFDKEYYESQVELKFAPEKVSKEYFDKVNKFLFRRFMEGYNYKINYSYGIQSTDNSPQFVGTHIHLFLEKNGKPFSKMVGVKYQILDYVYSKLLEFFNKIKDEKVISREVMFNELHRITTNHNILRYFDKEYMGDKLRSNMQKNGFDYRLFERGTDRKKYQPVLWSLANETGKPFSLELRIIPNLFLLMSTPKEMEDFVKGVEVILNSQPNKSIKAEVEASHIRSILANHNSLCEMAREFSSNKARNVEIPLEELRRPTMRRIQENPPVFIFQGAYSGQGVTTGQTSRPTITHDEFIQAISQITNPFLKTYEQVQNEMDENGIPKSYGVMNFCSLMGYTLIPTPVANS